MNAPDRSGSGPESERPEPSNWRTGLPPAARDRRLWLLLAVVAVLCFCCGATGAATAVNLVGRGYQKMLERSGRVVSLGQPARDGDLEFRVRAVECGASSVGDPLLNRTATGEFCLVRLDVRNLGNRPATFVDALQHAYGPGGQRFGPDPGAGLLANADQSVFLDRVAPGQRVSGAVVYDVPQGTRIVRLELHRAAGSPGVRIRTGRHR